MSNSESRLDHVARRTFLKRTAQLGAVLMVPGLAACGSSDKDAFSSTTTKASSNGAATTGSATTTAGSAATATTKATASTTAASKSAPPAGPPLTDAAKLTVDFTYAATGGGGRVQNPYIAVWLENEAEDLLTTISLWIANTPKGLKYVRELSRWYNAENERVSAGGTDAIDTISSATRVAGDYSVVWDGTDLDGARLTQGTYYLCIEASREHGPYELIREKITLGTEPLSLDLTPNGELTKAKATFVA
ncbi:MAG: DUF2271 domain-containing protein [Acidimicrobiia bacterium]